MRISDWSSDVCSSDLDGAAADDDMSALRDSLKRMPQPRPVAIPENRPAPVIADRQLSPSAAARPKAKQASLDLRDNYQLPPIDLLRAAPATGNTPIDKAALERNARLLASVLDDFNVTGSIVEVSPGPAALSTERRKGKD